VTTPWPGNVTATIEIGSQHGPPYDDKYGSYSDVINAFLALGWRIVNSYVEDKGPDSSREECMCLLGWPETSTPKYPTGYEQ
jgi:hypothetical protein